MEVLKQTEEAAECSTKNEKCDSDNDLLNDLAIMGIKTPNSNLFIGHYSFLDIKAFPK
jgi:hypothetical protein